jgi:glycosyltransferase involved in cell wall biosynthesis
LLSVIVPVYRNEGSIPELVAVLADMHRQLGGAFEAVLVIDGSPDRCYELLRAALPEAGFSSQLILLARNFGSFAAIRAGMNAARGDYFAVMAADLQEPPELVLEMHAVLAADEADVAVGVRDGRSDPWLSRLPATLFWGLYRRFVMKDIPPGGVDIFACNRPFRDQLLQLEERHSSLVAQIFWLGFRRRFVSYQRLERRHGKSAWTFGKKLTYLMDSVFAFTDLPIRLLLRIGGIATLLSALFGVLVVIARLLGAIDVPGYAATILVIVFFGALNLLTLGIVGSYAWRTYENTKARPLHVVLRSHDFARTEAAP